MFVKFSPKVPHMKVIPLLPAMSGSEVATFDNDTVTLRPGTNELTEKEWEAIQPHIQDQLGKEIVPFTVPVKTGEGGKETKAKTLKDVPVATARKIIQNCQDPKTLKKWFNQELPDEILLVLSKRMRKLKIEPEDLEDDDGGLDELKDDITPEGGAEPKPKAEAKAGNKKDEIIEDENTGEGEGAVTVDDDGGGDEEGPEDDEDEIPDFDGSRREG